MKIAVFPGTFDPITNGHVDLIERGAKLFDQFYILVSFNLNKITLFSINERVAQIEQAVAHIRNVKVAVNENMLTVDFAKKLDATTIVRGIRNTADFEYEFQMAQINAKLAPMIETIFLSTTNEHAILSSTMVKEVAKFGGDVTSFVPPHITNQLIAKFDD